MTDPSALETAARELADAVAPMFVDEAAGLVDTPEWDGWYERVGTTLAALRAALDADPVGEVEPTDKYRLRCGSKLCTYESCGCEWGCGDIRDAHAAGRAEMAAEVQRLLWDGSHREMRDCRWCKCQVLHYVDTGGCQRCVSRLLVRPEPADAVKAVQALLNGLAKLPTPEAP